ncbi:MAG: YwiC-like family protein [Anaerolineae bacterium]|nr:YwiC-like family protein [Anaerolineae bacterium]MCO5191254.1 YwiC-like family protein [Anaerolineae bacterium]
MSRNRPIRLRTVALPAEHGSWGLVLEPIALGLLIAPSWAGFWLSISAFFGFLVQRPLKIVLQDNLRGTKRPRTRYAQNIAAAYIIIALTAIVLAYLTGGIVPLLALLPALPFALVFFIYDLRTVRSWQAEFAAPTAFAAIVIAISIAGGLTWAIALALWAAMVARSVPSVLYIRARLRLVKGKPVSIAPALAASTVALIVVGMLVTANLLPATTLVAFIVLWLRTGGGLSRFRRDVTARTLGLIEMGLGAFTIACITIGFYLT